MYTTNTKIWTEILRWVALCAMLSVGPHHYLFKILDYYLNGHPFPAINGPQASLVLDLLALLHKGCPFVQEDRLPLRGSLFG